MDFSSIRAKRKFLKKSECESTTVSEISRRDPRLKRHLQEKSEDKEEEVKEKRSKGSTEEKEEEQHKTCEHRPVGSGNEVFDGALQKQDTTTEDSENQGGKRGSPSSRKQSQSRSPEARSPCTQERSSHKRRHGSFSPSSSTPKIRKVCQIGPKQPHVEEGLCSPLWTFQYQTDMVDSGKEFTMYKIIEKLVQVNDKKSKFIIAFLHKEYLNAYFHRFLSRLLNQGLMAKVNSICHILAVLFRTLQTSSCDCTPARCCRTSTNDNDEHC
ncbi:pre-mRNA cleavage complex 2 protein Pcf11-like isoform X1 [Strigops habroptila]|uniref:pre-mRNA cleavage complex 2 protein Pcf11-like isoform X1 n=1 Tax=Strigops habroptila TaxID=2489341 RepID=UPI0011CF5751|nr:pre-mRNA cleavage complex 2 protein Pcf11-like isoform X1 [Strigops habroptila]